MKPFLVSFSGMDGAGKSTQIDSLRGFLDAHGLRTRLLAFWDDVVVFARYREGFVHKVFKSERGIGAPGKPVNRRDKNVRGWHLNLARHGLYLLDALNLRRVLSHASSTKLDAVAQTSASPLEPCAARLVPDVIIMDRYIHDELANLPLGNAFTRAFIHIVAAIAPKPDVAYVLDADPDAARARKPEYPLEFLRSCRDCYLRLATMLRITVIPPSSVPQASEAIEQAFVRAFERKYGMAIRTTLRANGAKEREGISDPEMPLAG
jgi:thymidylate kinase